MVQPRETMERTWIAIDEAFQASQQTVPVWNREDENSASHHTSANTRQRTSHIVKKLENGQTQNYVIALSLVVPFCGTAAKPFQADLLAQRSEERRVGKECRSRRS